MVDPTPDDIVSVQPMTREPDVPIPWKRTTFEDEQREQSRKDRMGRARIQVVSGFLWVAFAVMLTVKGASAAPMILLWVCAVAHVSMGLVMVWMARKR